MVDDLPVPVPLKNVHIFYQDWVQNDQYSEFMGLGNMYDLKHSLLCTWLSRS